MRYSDIKSFTSDGLTALGYNPLPVFNPGPPSAETLQKRSPNAMVFLTVGSGAGLESEQLFDRPFIIVRALSKQGDYDYGEKLADDIDKMFLKINSNAIIGTAKVLWISRTGAGPTVVERDSADRYHWQCVYITSTQTGL
jgi:hypothetical protein